jgi:hypothetical protein
MAVNLVTGQGAENKLPINLVRQFEEKDEPINLVRQVTKEQPINLVRQTPSLPPLDVAPSQLAPAEDPPLETIGVSATDDFQPSGLEQAVQLGSASPRFEEERRAVETTFAEQTAAPEQFGQEVSGLQTPLISPEQIITDLATGAIAVKLAGGAGGRELIKGALRFGRVGTEIGLTMEAVDSLTDNKLLTALSPLVTIGLRAGLTVAVAKGEEAALGAFKNALRNAAANKGLNPEAADTAADIVYANIQKVGGFQRLGKLNSLRKATQLLKQQAGATLREQTGAIKLPAKEVSKFMKGTATGEELMQRLNEAIATSKAEVARVQGIQTRAAAERAETSTRFESLTEAKARWAKAADRAALTFEAQKPILPKDVAPPPPKPQFPGVTEAFLKQPKVKTTALDYFTPAEYHLKELGFDANIGQPLREALQTTDIELAKKADSVVQTANEHPAALKIQNKALRKEGKKPIKRKESKLLIREWMDKGIPKGKENTVEADIARKFRVGTDEMLTRMNEVRLATGQEPIKGLENYIFHMLKPEILTEIYDKGVIPPELTKIMSDKVPSKNLFLRTAQTRKGVPEDWLVKDPFELMKAMYAIDLRFIHLQKALHQVEPFVRAVRDYRGELPDGGTDDWSPATYEYLQSWINQAIKKQPSNMDELFNNLIDATVSPVLKKVGIGVGPMPWQSAVNFLSASVHTGALGMRAKPVLRNLVQSSFDWVLYGTKSYTKASAQFLTPGGHDILRKSKIWRTRVPFEAQNLNTLRKVFKAGSFGYRMADLHNVGKGILTRYHHAVDVLGKSPSEAIKWADKDLPATQWSYRREDLPRAYWTTTGRAAWTLGSWWMNFYRRLLPEVFKRTFKGVDVEGRSVPMVERVAGIRLLLLAGLLYGVKEKSNEVTGTNIDYTGQVHPAPGRESPILKSGLAIRDIAAGLATENEFLFKQGLRTLSHTSKLFVPYLLAAEEYYDFWTGEKTAGELFLYGKKEGGGRARPARPRPQRGGR